MGTTLNTTFLLLITLAGLMPVVAQDKDENKVFQKIEVNAYPNAKAWAAHIRKTATLPDSIQRNMPEGVYKAVVKFVVDTHGYIGQVTLKTDPGYGLGQRAVNIIRSYEDKWTPANQCGRFVKTYKEETILFRVAKSSYIDK